MLLMLPQEEVVGHTCNVIADNPMHRLAANLLGVKGRHFVRVLEEVEEQGVQSLHRPFSIFHDCRVRIDMREQKAF